MTICYDLGFAGLTDEFDGQPDAIQTGARVLSKHAGTIEEAAHSLSVLTTGSDGMTTRSFEALADEATEVKKKMSDAAMRYRAMAGALQTYSEVVRDEQAKVGALAEQGATATRNHSAAVAKSRQAIALSRVMDPTRWSEAVEMSNQAQAEARAASASLESAAAALQAGAQRLREANETAASKIRSAMEMSNLNDSWWAKALDTANTMATFVTDLLDDIGWVLDILLLVLAFVPGLGQALAAIRLGLLIIQFTAGVIQTAHAAFVREDSKEAWRLGLGVGLTVLTALVSKSAGKGAAKRFVSVGGKSVFSAARRQAAWSTNQVLSRIGPADALNRMTREQLFQRTTDLVAEGAEAGLSHVSSWLGQQGIDAVVPSEDPTTGRRTPVRPPLPSPIVHPLTMTTRRTTLPMVLSQPEGV